ncbi:urease accessory protein UreD [Millisia brevis]|uniref:urease accessory protein UreD n=1 Tax=Millisia brevis TaxID=264148 RepID=UPI000832FE49|nr:urease accessory protein UreD [Millisia brevis]
MPVNATGIDVRVDTAGRIAVDLRHGPMQARRVRASGGVVRVALIAGQALLLAGDAVRIEVSVVGPVTVEIIEPAGTVAYDMRGTPDPTARWDVAVRARDGARVMWFSEPFVVADGADVGRTTTVDVDATSVVALRETLVLGRTGERGGRLRTHTRAVRDAVPALVEDLDLDPATRGGWAVLGPNRCLDSWTVIGERLPDRPDTLQLDQLGSVQRWLGTRVHASPLDAPTAAPATHREAPAPHAHHSTVEDDMHSPTLSRTSSALPPRPAPRIPPAASTPTA